MSVVEPPVAMAGHLKADAPARARTGRRRLALASVGAGAIAACAWWATHPKALEPVAGGLVDAPVAVGDSVVLGMLAQPRSGEVRLVNAEPVVTQNTSGATVRVLLCGDPSGVTANMTIGSERGRAELVCTTTAPPQDATLGRVVPRHPSLVIEVTPRAPGAVTINGLRVRYRTGFQQGVQESGLKVTVRTPVGAD